MPDTNVIEPGQPTDDDVITLLQQAARDTDLGVTPDLAVLVRGGRRRVTRRRHTTLAVAAAAAVAVALLVGPVGGLGRTATPPTHDRVGPLPSPTASQQDRERLLASSAERAEFARLLADPTFRITNAQYTNASSAAVLMQTCDSTGCEAAVLTTDTNWRDQAGYVVPGRVSSVLMTALPGGYAAIIPSDRDSSSGHPPATPVILGPDGATRPLTVVTDVRDTTWGSILLARPPLWAANNVNAALWAVDPERAELFPTSYQPCACQGQVVSRPVMDSDSVLHVTVQDAGSEEEDFGQSRDNGLTWTTSRTNVLYNRVAPARGTYFTAGPGRRLAAAYTTEDTVPTLRDLYLSDDGRTWRRADLQKLPKTLTGMAFTPAGDLLLADGTQLWRVDPDGTDAIPVEGAPPVLALDTSGGVLVATSSDGTLVVSTDGSTWADVAPGNSLIPADATNPDR
jgi:hypothetical protein